MQPITLESIKAEQSKLAEMIAKIEEDMKKEAFFEYEGKRFSLNPGERYIASLKLAGESHTTHFILLPGDNDGAGQKKQMEWAKSIGGELPDRVISPILFATMKDEFKSEAYWTCERYVSDSDYAWYQDFYGGDQGYHDTDLKLRARAVRKLISQ